MTKPTHTSPAALPLFYRAPGLLRFQDHARLGVRRGAAFGFATGATAIPVVAGEFHAKGRLDLIVLHLASQQRWRGLAAALARPRRRSREDPHSARQLKGRSRRMRGAQSSTAALSRQTMVAWAGSPVRLRMT